MQRFLQAARLSQWTSVISVFAERRDLTLHLELWHRTREPVENWMVSCQGVREFSLSDFSGGGLNWWTKDHPLISQFTSPKASLRIRLPGDSAEAVIGYLLAAHVAMVDDWIPFERFAARILHGDANAISIAGPEFLLQGYVDRLSSARIPLTFKRHKRKLYWCGSGWSERRYDVSLLHFGASFVPPSISPLTR